MQETQVPSLGQEDPLEEGMASTPVFLPEKSHDRGAWQATVHGVAKSRTGLRRLSMHTHTQITQGWLRLLHITHKQIVKLNSLCYRRQVLVLWKHLAK